MRKVYFNVNYGQGVETVDELSESDFESYREFRKEYQRLRAEYHLCQMPVYISQRATKEWYNR
tara:strand:+ start:363 stop:551 length:189 start_codon:yes stop_codon:yes gene_type:complete